MTLTKLSASPLYRTHPLFNLWQWLRDPLHLTGLLFFIATLLMAFSLLCFLANFQQFSKITSSFQLLGSLFMTVGTFLACSYFVAGWHLIQKTKFKKILIFSLISLLGFPVGTVPALLALILLTRKAMRQQIQG